MEFFEAVAMLGVTVVLPITIVRSVLKYKKDRLEAERGGAGLTVGELKSLLAEVVREANAPLLERIEELEGRGLLEGMEDGEDEADFEEAGKSVGRRVMS